MIQPIVTALEAFKAKVDTAIEHFRGGVNALNEDQIDQGVELLHDLGDHYDVLRKTVLKHLAPSVPDATGDSHPSAADLDAVADEQKAKDATE